MLLQFYFRSLPLNDAVTTRHERTPTGHRAFERERESSIREHRRERDRDRDYDVEGTQAPLSPIASRSRPVRKSSSAHRIETTIVTDKRRFFCREWAFQKIAHCLEQRPISKTCGALILGDAGSGKTALCQELSEPGQGPQARQQRALNRRLLARHFLQGNAENSQRPGDFVRSLAMQILSHSTHNKQQRGTPGKEQQSPSVNKGLTDLDSPTNIRQTEEERLIRRFRDLGDDGEDSSKPLLGDSEDQRTDEEETMPARRGRTIDRLHERADYMDLADAALSRGDELPEILPRISKAEATNPFLSSDQRSPHDFRVYENHENLFLRNVSQRQSKEMRNSRLFRQSSEPLTEKKANVIQKSLSTEQKTDSASESEQKDSKQVEKSKSQNENINSSPPNAKISRIPVANFRYPNKRSSSAENSPHKSKPTDSSSDKDKKTNDNEEIEYQNILKPKSLSADFEKVNERNEIERLLEKKRSENDDVPPPIPSLPVNPRTLIANAYYEKLLSEPEIQKALLPQNLEKNPDECFKKALLFPLLEIDPPKQCLFLLVDAIDEGILSTSTDDRSINSSKTVAELLANHHHLFPQWLLLVCTARKQSKSLTKMFTGFRKIALDELHRAHVSADVQKYVLARLDTEPRLRARVSSDSTAAAAAAAALDHLRIKSDGCLLYLEKVLDGVADGFIALREIKEIPGTLNGLYLWLAQRLFHGRRFTKVRLLLDVLLAARCGVSEEMLYKCLLTKEYSVTREDFNRRLHLLRRILVMEQSTGFLTIFHHSFASWLVDVKHCTRRYLCSPSEGHAALAMYYTLEAKRLSAMEIHNYVLHMTNIEQYLAGQKKNKSDNNQEMDQLDLHTLILLWVLDSGCDIELALRKDSAIKNFDAAIEINAQATEEKIEECVQEEKDAMLSETMSPIETLIPEFISGLQTPGWPQDARVLKALLELTRTEAVESKVLEDPVEEVEINGTTCIEQRADSIENIEVTEDPIDSVILDPATVHELATRGEDDTLQILLKRYPHAVELMDVSGGTALHCAARGGRASTASLLLRGGASVDAADGDGWTALRAAAWAGHTEVVDVLLDFGCQVDCVDSDNRTALRAAAWSGHEAVVTRLLAAGAAPDKADGEGRTPLIAAAYMGHADIVKALLDAGAEVDHADEDDNLSPGRTALSVASICASGSACAALLLERGADVSKVDREKASPLLVAAFEGHTEICELLLEHEADPEAADAGGRTALWAAASAGHADTVRLLLYWGACVDNMDAEGRTVLSTAAAQGEYTNCYTEENLLLRGAHHHSSYVPSPAACSPTAQGLHGRRPTGGILQTAHSSLVHTHTLVHSRTLVLTNTDVSFKEVISVQD
ncbi:Ankyrin repeat domain-containing protein 50 [Eumeta japonica]|uniref:Ankyrin repeat domain-containing protein 50 n=1 Tax=Eumeta variegata TaxID=151549 RepID=A0A4C1WBN3_EUMVA|nr:Ankyrin repeat domain-containing protein 50 [Eumeta japonica]